MPPPRPGDSSGSNARDARAAARDAARKQARPETTDKPTTSSIRILGFTPPQFVGTRVVEPPVESRQNGDVRMPPALKQFIDGLSPTERATLTPTQIISRAAARGII